MRHSNHPKSANRIAAKKITDSIPVQVHRAVRRPRRGRRRTTTPKSSLPGFPCHARHLPRRLHLAPGFRRGIGR